MWHFYSSHLSCRSHLKAKSLLRPFALSALTLDDLVSLPFHVSLLSLSPHSTAALASSSSSFYSRCCYRSREMNIKKNLHPQETPEKTVKSRHSVSFFPFLLLQQEGEENCTMYRLLWQKGWETIQLDLVRYPPLGPSVISRSFTSLDSLSRSFFLAWHKMHLQLLLSCTLIYAGSKAEGEFILLPSCLQTQVSKWLSDHLFIRFSSR